MGVERRELRVAVITWLGFGSGLEFGFRFGFGLVLGLEFGFGLGFRLGSRSSPSISCAAADAARAVCALG